MGNCLSRGGCCFSTATETGAKVLRIRDMRNFLSGLLFMGLSGVLAWNALSLHIGEAREMGPGYVPLMLALILGGLGLAIAISGLRVDGEALARIEWRGFVLIIGAILAFGLSIERLGFVPAIAITAGICSLASTRYRIATALGLIAVLVAFCWAVFILGLGLPVKMFG